MPYFRTRFKEKTNNSQKAVITAHPPPRDAWDKLHGEYRYSLPQPFAVDRDDAVLSFIIQTIQNLQIKNIHVAIQRYWIQGLTCHLPIWPLNYRNAQFPTKLYTIKRCWEEFPSCISVMIEDRGSMNPILTVDRVKAQVYPATDGDRWKPIDEYLASLAAPAPEGRIHPALTNLEAQQRWWNLTGDSFPFLDLPKEIRLKILSYVLGGEVRPATRSRYQRGMETIALTESKAWPGQHTRDNALPNKNIFLVSNQVRDEAWEALLTGTEKVFYNHDNLVDVLQCRIPVTPASTNFLAKVTLKLTTTKFFEFFGWDFTPTLAPRWNRSIATVAAQMIQRSSTIETLTLDFQNPYTDGRNPWHPNKSMWDPDDRCEPPNLERLWTTADRYSPCYRAIVEWILIVAFSYIKCVPKVNLRGSVKKDINEVWSHILDTEYKKSVGAEVFHPHRFDYETSLNHLRSIPASALPPKCKCPKLCYLDRSFDIPGYCQWARERIEKQVYAFDHNDSFQLQEHIDICEWLKKDTDEKRAKFDDSYYFDTNPEEDD